MTDISGPFLHTIKCSDCHLYIDIRTLDCHQCEKSKTPVIDIKHSNSNGISNNNSSSNNKKIKNDSNNEQESISGSLLNNTLQRRSREKNNATHALNIGMKKILQKMKGNEQYQLSENTKHRAGGGGRNSSSADAANALLPSLSPTLSTFTASTASTIPTPRSSNNDHYYQHYISPPQHQNDSGSENSHYHGQTNSYEKGSKEPATLSFSNSHHGHYNAITTDNRNKSDLDAIYCELLSTMNLKEESCSICHQTISMNDASVKDLKSKQLYHKSCFCCTLCRVPLSSASACEFNRKLFCPRDFQVMKTRALKSKTMPKMCFHCKRELKDGETFKTYKNRIYCHSDFLQLFAPKCRSCAKPVEKEAVSAMDGKLEGKWHMECFNCQICHRDFPDNTFYVFDNQPYCKKHYHYLNNSLCSRCHEGIENLCAHTAEGWRFHPSCFTCEICQQRLSDTYYVFESRIYCEGHIRRQVEKDNSSSGNSRSLLDKRRTHIFNLYHNNSK